MKARVRDAVGSDSNEIVRLNLESEHFLSRMDLPRLRMLREQAACLRVAQIDGRLAAFLLAFAPRSAYDSENYRWFDARHESFIYVDRVVVDARERGRGLGALLYADVFDFAREGGYERVVCEFDVEPPNPVSANLHARFGFREVGWRQVSYADKRVSMQEALLAR